MNIPKKYLKFITDDIGYCQDCQPYDNEEEDGLIWILGERVDLCEYLSDIGLPEKYYNAVDQLSCPNCGAPLSIGIDVGLKSKYEKQYEKKYKHITKKINPQIQEFANYIQKYPYLGAKHKVGKLIYNEIKESPIILIKNETWYRGRNISESVYFEIDDMLPPNPEKVVITEGRFNHYGQSHYYLGDSKNLCGSEICVNDHSICWIQEIKIIKAGKILDLSGYLSEDNIDNIPLIFAGIMNKRVLTKKVKKGTSWKPEYFVPRYIADICKEEGIMGIKYNSAIAFGDNLVIFDLRQIEYEFINNPYIYEFKREKEMF